jgi:hypothetical protein
VKSEPWLARQEEVKLGDVLHGHASLLLDKPPQPAYR